jgi:hypothetical protein
MNEEAFHESKKESIFRRMIFIMKDKMGEQNKK